MNFNYDSVVDVAFLDSGECNDKYIKIDKENSLDFVWIQRKPVKHQITKGGGSLNESVLESEEFDSGCKTNEEYVPKKKKYPII